MDQKQLPKTNNPLVVRTDFENQQAWRTICKLIRAPVPAPGDTFYAYVQFLEDVAFRGLGTKELLACVPSDYNHSFLYLLLTAPRSAIRSFQSLPLTCVELTAAISVRFR